jgi:hypothetical protein
MGIYALENSSFESGTCTVVVMELISVLMKNFDIQNHSG